MKVKLSISLDQETVQKVEERLQDGTFRNKSHCFEWAVKQQLGSKMIRPRNEEHL